MTTTSRFMGKPLLRGPVILAIGLLIAAALVVNWHRSQARLQTAFERLQLVHGLRAAALEDLISSLQTDIEAASESPRMKAVITELVGAWRDLGPAAQESLRNAYLKHPGEPRKTDPSGEDAQPLKNYDQVHRYLDEWAGRFLEHFGYYDLFLIDGDGNVLYTKAKEDDFGTNLFTGTLRDSNLTQAVRSALEHQGEVALADFQRYAPSANEPAAFAAKTIVEDGSVLGVFAVQLPREPIEAVMVRKEGMGDTGETYAVGPDRLMRNQSRFIRTPTLLNTKVDTEAVSQGLAGVSGSRIITDYRGVPVLSVWRAVQFGDTPWVLIAEIDEQEATGFISP
jgi:methyl-accepting chemotaxis protein